MAKARLNMNARLLAALLLSFQALAHAQTPEIDPSRGCATNPARVAPCFRVEGRAFLANGTPSLRIASGKRVFGVLPAEQEIMPSALREQLTWSQDLRARFELCPFTRATPHTMQFVCVESASRIQRR